MGNSIGDILSSFNLSDKCTWTEISSGLINKTYLVSNTEKDVKYVFQEINKSIFPNVEALMNNIELVNNHLRSFTKSQFPSLLKTISGQNLLLDRSDRAWRVYEFIENSKTINQTRNSKVAKEAGKAVGQFHVDMDGFDSKKLSNTLPNFHTLSTRLNQLDKAILSSTHSNRGDVLEMISMIDRIKSKFNPLFEIDLPLRVTHNDTKLNNILFDNNDEYICLIDLDTLMPGYLYTDFGDALRTLSNPVGEDEKDISKVQFDLNLFESFTGGFLLKTNAILTQSEKSTLPLSIPYMPFIMAIRFLTDYLNGDIYYKVSYEHQNLDRAKNQLALVKNVSDQFDAITSVFTKFGLIQT
ncbi:MAG: phosphotransferase enzyme family protein [Ekhidna sp.]